MHKEANLVLALLLVALGLAACGNGETTPPDAEKLADTLSGDARGPASANSRCALFSREDIASLAGEPVEEGGNAAGGLGCQWPASDGSGLTIVTVAPGEYHNPISGAEAFRELPDVPEDGFVARDGPGWTAGAKIGGRAVVVGIDGDRTSEAKVIELLKRSAAKVSGGAVEQE